MPQLDRVVKRTKAHTLTFLKPLLLGARCIVGHHHGSNHEVKCLADILANEHISQMLDTPHGNSDIYQQLSERMKDRGWTLCQTEKKKAIHTATRRASFWQLLPGGTYQGAICSSGWVCCVLTANEPLLFLLISAQLSAIAVFTYGQTYWAKEGNALLFQSDVSGVNIKNLEEDQEGIQQRETLRNVEWRILGEQRMLEPLLEK